MKALSRDIVLFSQYLNHFTTNNTKKLNKLRKMPTLSLLSIEKNNLIVPCESTIEEVSFEW